MRRVSSIPFLILLFATPVVVNAQTRTIVSAYVGADATMADDPLLVGLTAARETGPMAARLSLGFDMTTPPAPGDLGAPAPTAGVFNGDADALLYLGNPRGGPIVPYALGGVGLRGYREDGGLGAAANYSYGAGFRAPLGGGFGMEAELRQRNVIGARSDAGLPPTVSSGLEYRFGFSVGFGGGAGMSLPNVRPAPVPSRGNVGGGTYASADARGRVVAATLSSAERYIGVPYQWGGNTPQEGFDCSGFIRYVYSQNGVSLPRVSRDQARFGESLALDIRSFEAGDILAFASDGRTVDHTAIYAGGGRIIHSSSSGNGVRYDDLFSQRGKWYVDHLVAARRVVDGGLAIR